MGAGLRLYAMTTKIDFTAWVAWLWSFVIALIFLSIISIFVWDRWLTILISMLMVMILSIYIIFDIQLITGKNSAKYSIDDYILAAMLLYIDILRLFVEILKIVAAARGQ